MGRLNSCPHLQTVARLQHLQQDNHEDKHKPKPEKHPTHLAQILDIGL